MNAVETYTREMLKIFQQITETIKAAESDKSLNESERYIIKLILQQVRSKLADGIFDLSQLCKKYEEICDTLQSSILRN